jgi:cation diffusion facilitator CzcD-associated flavoprotein CzcO
MIMRPVFGIVEELFAFQFNLRGNLRPKDDVVSDFYNVALVLNSDLKDMRKAGKVAVQMGEIQEIDNDGTTIKLKDASKLQADLLVFSTGFTQDYSMFDPSTIRDLDLQEDGMYLYRYILPEKVPNLAFIGHVAAISNISSYGLQAEWLARNLTGCLISGGSESSTPETMHAEIEARKQWARSWMPKSDRRGMLVLLHQTHYHDQLLRDMGENPHRKGGLAEYLMPYEPADYNGIMGGSVHAQM